MLSFFRENFERICKGEELRIPSMDTDLKCRLIHHNDLYLLLGPFRYKKINFYLAKPKDCSWIGFMFLLLTRNSSKAERSGVGTKPEFVNV
jgi:hypothetical protein